jgi:hypothetical protein
LSNRNADLSALAAGQDRNEGLRELIALFCLDLCTKEKPDPLQAACLVRDYLETYSEPLPYQEMVMSGLLDAIRTPDDAVRLKDRLWLERFRSELTDQWLKRLEARAYPETMLDGQHCDPVTLTIAGALERATYIKGALWRGHCALAYELICDFAAALDQCPVVHNFPELADLCAQRNLRTFNTRLYEAGKGSDDSAYFQGQKGKMMLCEFLARGEEASTIEDHHVDYFKQLGRCMSGLDGEVISRELLDVPEPDRAELLRNPKTRHLLRLTGYPAIVAEIVGDEQKANDRIMNSLKQLQAEGFIFSDFAGEKPINIFRPGSPSHQSINLLLELAEAAVLTTSLGNWAAGVVQYLSTQLLTPDQVKKAIALCDDIRSTVQFSPDPTLSTTLDAVKALTDAAKFENNAEAVFLDRLQKLKDAGIVFSGDPLTTKETESIEVEGGVFGEETVDMLLDLAEAAVKSQGWTNWAIGVLSFLSDRVLADDQMNRAVSIRRRIR